MVGDIGSADRLEFATLGDVVNVASRLQAANKEVGTNMLVSDAVFAGCRNDIEFGRSFDLDLRGKLGRVRAHEVRSVRTPRTDNEPPP